MPDPKGALSLCFKPLFCPDHPRRPSQQTISLPLKPAVDYPKAPSDLTAWGHSRVRTAKIRAADSTFARA
jgi:hypothetical protein